jgi:hypothetical protein
MLLAEGASRNFRVSIKSAVDLQENDRPREASA